MKKLLLVAFAGLLLAGCASISYDGKSFSYTRWGDQKIDGLTVTRGADGSITVGLAGQQSQAQQLAELMQILKAMQAPGRGTP